MASISGISGSAAILKIHISFELGAVDYSELPIFILIQFWKIRKFLMKGLRESPCIISCTGRAKLDVSALLKEKERR
jgi:hypothetical protein